MAWVKSNLGLLFCDYGSSCCVFLQPVLESLKYGTGIIRGFSQSVKNAVSHVNGCFECFFLAAILTVGEVFGELIPLAADAESPALE